jgi:hypothetical protein
LTLCKEAIDDLLRRFTRRGRVTGQGLDGSPEGGRVTRGCSGILGLLLLGSSDLLLLRRSGLVGLGSIGLVGLVLLGGSGLVGLLLLRNSGLGLLRRSSGLGLLVLGSSGLVGLLRLGALLATSAAADLGGLSRRGRRLGMSWRRAAVGVDLGLGTRTILAGRYLLLFRLIALLDVLKLFVV